MISVPAFPARCLLFCEPNVRLNGLEPLLAAEPIQRRPAGLLLHDEVVIDAPAVLLIDQSLARQMPAFDAVPPHVTLVTCDTVAEASFAELAQLSLTWCRTPHDKLRVLLTAFQLSAARRNEVRARLEAAQSRKELKELNRIGMSLMTERDRDALLHLIVTQAMQLTTSDAGALYLLEESPSGTPMLRFKIALCESAPSLRSLQDISYPVDSSTIVSHAAKTRVPMVIDDAHNLPADTPFELNPLVEQHFGYWLKSMVTIPMLGHHGKVVGVLQLANRKSTAANILRKADADRYVVPYGEREVQLALSLAGQAAVSIENTQLHAQIEHIFESFVKTTVSRIEERDPSTAGHSIRVARLVSDLAGAVERADIAPYRGVHFSVAQRRELHYAALLHDVGKVGVRENLLLKAKKVPVPLWERMQARFELIRSTMVAEYQTKRAGLLLGRDQAELVAALEAEFNHQLHQLEDFALAIRAANEPVVLTAESAALLDEVASHTFVRYDGRVEPYLREEELHYLRIPHGTLDASERKEIEAHARLTFQFLSQVPWTADLRHVASYAASHHEKLNGTGYPEGLTAKDIPLQARLVGIADIFDALTAADRTYRVAVPPEAALNIIESEAKVGLLDADLVQIMIASEVYRNVLTDNLQHM